MRIVGTYDLLTTTGFENLADKTIIQVLFFNLFQFLIKVEFKFYLLFFTTKSFYQMSQREFTTNHTY